MKHPSIPSILIYAPNHFFVLRQEIYQALLVKLIPHCLEGGRIILSRLKLRDLGPVYTEVGDPR